MGKPGSLWKGSSVFMPVVFLLAIAFLVTVNATSYGDTPPSGATPPSQAVTPAAPAPADSALTPAQVPAGPPPSEAAKALKQAQESLTKEVFSYSPEGMLDPFVPFITPAAVAPPKPAEPEEPDTSMEPESPRPMTPLQKMSLGEIEKGLKAITWGDLGRRALVEDSAGKGYIINIGTPLGDRNGVVTQIFNDHLVIQQEVWDRDSKKMVPQISVVKLWKEKK